MASTPASVVTAVNTTGRIEEKSIPEGYVLLYSGVRKSDNRYTSPTLSVHIYNESESTTNSDFAQITIDNPKCRSPAYQLGMTQNLRQNNFSLDEQVLIIPVGDILSMCYRTDTKKEVKIQTASISIANPPKKNQGRCARFCCCCCCNKSEESESERRGDQIVNDKAAKRVIIITIEYFRYGCIDTPSHMRVLNENDRAASYSPPMNVDTLQFYLLVSDELDSKQFNLQRNQVETLSRLITRIKQMTPQEYPSEIQLQHLVQRQVLETSAITYSSTKIIPPIMTQPIHTNDGNNSGYF